MSVTRSAKKGFTLIELLVVIAIIALLMAVIVPSLRKAKEAAKIAICKSNLHQFGLALISYANSNDDRIVPGDWAWGTTIYMGSGANTGNCPGKNKPKNIGWLLETGYLPIPTSRSHLFYCPADKANLYDTTPGVNSTDPTHPAARWFKDRWGKDYVNWIDTSYEYRDGLDGGHKGNGSDDPATQKGAKLSEIPNDTSIVTDRLAWGYNLFYSHTRRFACTAGDGSVREFDDREHDDSYLGTGLQDPMAIGLANFYYENTSRYGLGSWDWVLYDAMDYVRGARYCKPKLDEKEQKQPPILNPPPWRQ